MSFGFGIGDFLAVFEFATKVRDKWTDAPKEYKAIKDETRNIENVLRDIGELGMRMDLSKEREIKLKQACQSCREVIEECEKLVDNYSSVQNATSGRFKVRRAWAKLQMDPDVIRRLRNQLSAQTSHLGLLYDLIVTDLVVEINEGVQNLQHSDAQRERTMVADWYSVAEFASQQTDQLSSRQSGTGSWFLSHASYQQWRQQTNGTLLCPGIPGSGKSVMAAAVINDIQASFGANKDVIVAYLYCNFNRQAEQDFPRMLAILIRQLFQERSHLPDEVTALYRTHRDRATRPSIDELSNTLRSLVNLYSRVFVIIDALDECANTEKQRDSLLDELFFLQGSNGNNVNVLATTRFIPDIVQRFSGHPQIEIRADKGDIQLYLDSRMARLAKFVVQDIQLQEEIKHFIVNAADGMFLLARLQFDSLRDKTNRGHMREALAKLEKGSDALNGEYAKAVERIEHQLLGWRNLARRTLLWITYATRQLSIDELQEAVAIDPYRNAFDVCEYLDDEDQIVSVCQGLVEVDQQSRIVRLVHYTTQKYFEEIRDQWLPEGQLAISQSCIAYLRMEVFMHSRCRWGKDLLPIIKRHRFVEYAGKSWGFYVRDLDNKELEANVINFLHDTDCLRFTSQVTLGEASYRQDEYRCYTSEISAAHIVSHFNLSRVMEILIQQGEDINFRDSDRRTPLSRAAESGHIETMQLLLGQPGIEVNARDKHGRTSLFQAAERGHGGAVSLLLAQPGIEITAKDWDRETPLSRAARAGHTGIVQLLLDQPGIEINAINKYGRTPLSQAAQIGHMDTVRLLLARPEIEINTGTALSLAAKGGHMEIIQLLLAQPGIEINAKDRSGRTPLSRAAKRGYTEIVQLLLSQPGIDINE